MSKLRIFVSATFVLIFLGGFARANPLDQVPPEQIVEEHYPDKPPDENLSISQPPKRIIKPPRDLEYYPYQEAFTLRFGKATDFSSAGFNDTVIGFQYQFPKFLSPRLEAGADLHNEGRGHVHAGARWYAWERSYFRPSLKAAGDWMINSKEGLGTLVKLENFYLRSAATIEYVVWNPYSLRLEAEFLVGSQNGGLELTIGISRGW